MVCIDNWLHRYLYVLFIFLATDLERLVQKLGTPEDSEPLRDR